MATETEHEYEDDFDEKQSVQPLSARGSVYRFPAVRLIPQKKKPVGLQTLNSRNVSGKSQVFLGKRSLAGTANRSMKLPPVRLTKSDLRTGSEVAERILSAKARRVQDLENDRNTLRNQVESQMREIRVLNQMMRRQGKALQQYEGKEDQAMYLKSEEESRILREQLRQMRQKYAQIRELNRQLEAYSVNMEKERDKLAAVVRDHELLEGKSLKDERDDLAAKLSEAEVKIRELDRMVLHLKKSQERSQNATITKLKQQLSDYENVMMENLALREQLINKSQGIRTKVAKRPPVGGAEKVNQTLRANGKLPRKLGGTPPLNATDPSSLRNQRQNGSLPPRETDRRTSEQGSDFSFTNHEFGDFASVSKNGRKPSVNADGDRLPPVNRWNTGSSPDILKDHHGQSRSMSEVPVMDTTAKIETGPPPAKLQDSGRKQKLLESLNAIDQQRATSIPDSPELSRESSVHELESEDLPETDAEKVKRDVAAKNELLERIRSLNFGLPEVKQERQFGGTRTDGSHAVAAVKISPRILSGSHAVSQVRPMPANGSQMGLVSNGVPTAGFPAQHLANRNNSLVLSDDEEDIEYF